MKPHSLEGRVVVAGAGPAGTAAALRLEQLGCPVLLVDDLARPAVGETVPPGVAAILDRIGAADSLFSHLPSPGAEAVWGSEVPRAHDFLFAGRGPGWHLDRARFDAELRARLRTPRWSGSVRWVDGSLRLPGWTGQPAWVLDATGRARAIGRGAGVERVAYDATRAQLSRWRSTARDRTTLVEAVRDGWWYLATLPGGDLILGAFSEGEDLGPPPPRCQARLRGAARVASWQRPAWVEFPTRLVGPGWLLTGEAALALDPLSSQGITRALDLGISAAEAVVAALSGDAGALERHVQAIRRLQAEHLAERLTFYRAEQRFADRPFWRRQHQRVELDPATWLEPGPRPAHRGCFLPPSALQALVGRAPATAEALVRSFLQQVHAPARDVVLALQSLTAAGALAERGAR